MPQPFHVAVPVYDLEEARKFYVNLLDCKIGRTSNQWVDFDFFGHQFVLHLKSKPNQEKKITTTLLMDMTFQCRIME